MKRLTRLAVAAVKEECQAVGAEARLAGYSKHFKVAIVFRQRTIGHMSISGTPKQCHLENECRREVRRLLKAEGLICG